MKLLQNTAGNFLNMTPEEPKSLAAKLLLAAEAAPSAKPGRGAGFVQTIILQEHRLQDMERRMCAANVKTDDRYYGEIDTIFVGISPTHIDVHPNLVDGLKPRSPHIMNIDREDINVGLHGGR